MTSGSQETVQAPIQSSAHEAAQSVFPTATELEAGEHLQDHYRSRSSFRHLHPHGNHTSIQRSVPSRNRRQSQRGLTLVELVVTFTILAILATAAVPIAHYGIRREKERELRANLLKIRGAIDRYKEAADLGFFIIKIDSLGYPPELKSLVEGVEIQGKKVKFLSQIPIDPITGTADWGMRAVQDDPTSDSWGGQDVYDVFSKSPATALDGTKYSTW